MQLWLKPAPSFIEKFMIILNQWKKVYLSLHLFEILNTKNAHKTGPEEPHVGDFKQEAYIFIFFINTPGRLRPKLYIVLLIFVLEFFKALIWS